MKYEVLKELNKIFEERMSSKLDKIGEVVVKKSQQILEGNVGHKTELTKSIKHRKIGSCEVEVYCDNIILDYLEKGTKPHIIEPKNKKSLAFRVTDTTVKSKTGKVYSFGETVLAKKVKHPGFEARPFFHVALFLSKREIEKIILS
jgi:hypothetical protein